MNISRKTALSAIAIGTALSGGGYGVSEAAAKGFGQGNGECDGTGNQAVERPENRQYANQMTDEDRAAHQADRQRSLEERLAHAVSDGNLTEDQKALILEKHAEIRADREDGLEEWRSLSREERRERIEERRTELEQWATANGIDPQYVLGSAFGGHGRR